MDNVTKPRNPVLLIHGIFDTQRVFHKMATYLGNRGWSIHCLDLVPNNGDVGLDKLAQQLADYVTASFAPQQAIDLVAFSMGGLVSRYYVQRLGGMQRVQRFITISTPNHGTVIAYFPQNHAGKQMRPQSLFLQDLNRDVGILEQLNYTSIWTPFDLMIVPAKSSKMAVGREVVLPVGLHPWMLTDKRSLAVIAQELAAPVKGGVH